MGSPRPAPSERGPRPGTVPGETGRRRRRGAEAGRAGRRDEPAEAAPHPGRGDRRDEGGGAGGETASERDRGATPGPPGNRSAGGEGASHAGDRRDGGSRAGSKDTSRGSGRRDRSERGKDAEPTTPATSAESAADTGRSREPQKPTIPATKITPWENACNAGTFLHPRPLPGGARPGGEKAPAGRERKGGPRKVFAQQNPELTVRATLRKKFQGALALTSAGARLLPLRAPARFASQRTQKHRKEEPFNPRTAPT